MATKTHDTRAHRWNVRIAEADDELIRAASEVAETNLSEFVRAAAVSEARRVLADRRQFVLDPAAWEQFSEMLERPARVPEGLKDLFSQPSAFE